MNSIYHSPSAQFMGIILVTMPRYIKYKDMGSIVDKITNVTYDIIFSDSVPRNFEIYIPNRYWWTRIEEKEYNKANIGERYLVRREFITRSSVIVVCDYISTRINSPELWRRACVAYLPTMITPYPYHYDKSVTLPPLFLEKMKSPM